MIQVVQPLSPYQLINYLPSSSSACLSRAARPLLTWRIHHEDLLEMHSAKVESYLAMIRKFEATAEGIKAGRERLQSAESTVEDTVGPVSLCIMEELPDQFNQVTVSSDLKEGQALRSGKEDAAKHAEVGGVSQYVRIYFL